VDETVPFHPLHPWQEVARPFQQQQLRRFLHPQILLTHL
jgi:hypothetical protein